MERALFDGLRLGENKVPCKLGFVNPLKPGRMPGRVLVRFSSLGVWACLLAMFGAGGMCITHGANAPDYMTEIKPLLEKRCYSCHSRLKQKNELRLDAGALIHKGGKHGPVIIPGKSGESPLMERITATNDDERMPPDGKSLTEEQIGKLRAWIDAGATYPSGEPIPSSPADHWSFQPVKRPTVPQVKDQEWVRNPIDKFILAKLEARGLRPSAPAQPWQLLRRACLDLAGLPPSIAEQEAFAQRIRTENSSLVMDDLIGSLLARPQYGERWARHWLDVVRYADSNGYERDAAKPFVWRYRDWVIRALNDDKPYNRFLIEQIAGDELSEANADSMIATGMLRLGHWDDEPADPDADRFDQLDDIVSTTSLAVLGLTVGCARCHDHKFEPIPTRDYYSMVAVFNPLRRPQDGRTELAPPVGTRAELAALAARDRRIGDLKKEVAEHRRLARDQWLESGQSHLSSETVAAFTTDADKRSDAQKKLASEFSKKLEEELDAVLAAKTNATSGAAANSLAGPDDISSKLAASNREIDSLRVAVPDLPQAYIWREAPGNQPPTHVLIRGNPKRHGDEVVPAVPVVLAKAQPVFPPPNEFTSHRRLGFAQWLASEENPMPARVIVNRVWQQHFGVGLVRTPNDFGLMGEPPTHPELLDWLADWFVHDAGWSLKKLHRLILTSNSWRMSRASSSRASPGSHGSGSRAGVAGDSDPENKLLSHLPLRRLEAEAVRDSILAVSGQLNLAMYGPAIFPQIPDAALEANTDKQSIWKASSTTDAARRTIYVYIKRGLVVPMLEVLDLCDTVSSTGRRQITTVAPQALTLFNGEFVNEQARHFAARLAREAGNDPVKGLDLAFRLALARLPTESERNQMSQFIRMDGSGDGAGESTGLIQMCRVIFNLNEFVYPD